MKSEISLDEPLNTDWDGNELLLSDILGTDGDIIFKNIESEVDRVLLKQAISKLSGREKTIIELRFDYIMGRKNPERSCRPFRYFPVLYI